MVLVPPFDIVEASYLDFLCSTTILIFLATVLELWILIILQSFTSLVIIFGNLDLFVHVPFFFWFTIAAKRTPLFSETPMITLNKLVGSQNYLSWADFVDLWFLSNGCDDHLITTSDKIPKDNCLLWIEIDALLCNILR